MIFLNKLPNLNWLHLKKPTRKWNLKYANFGYYSNIDIAVERFSIVHFYQIISRNYLTGSDRELEKYIYKVNYLKYQTRYGVEI